MRNKGKAHIPEQLSLWPPWRPETDRWLVHQAATHRRALTQPDVTTPAGQGARWPMTLNVLQDFLNTKPWNFTKSVPPLKSKQKVPQRATCPCCSMDTTCPHAAVVLNEAGLYLATGAEKVCGVLGRHVPVNTTENKELQPICPQHVDGDAFNETRGQTLLFYCETLEDRTSPQTGEPPHTCSFFLLEQWGV